MSESNDRRIDDATPDTNVTGVEKVPVSDGGTAKCLTVEQIKDFVATKFAALQNASGVEVNSDGVYLKKDGELKPVAASVFADAIIAFMFGKESETELAETDDVVISRGGTAKVATVEAFANIIKEIVQFDAIDIASMDLWDLSGRENAFLIASVPVGEGAYENKKFYFIDLISRFWQEPEIPSGQQMSQDDTEIVVCDPTGRDGGPTLKSVPISNVGFGKGDVNGPSVNTDGKIPQWDGANSKKLKDGLSLVHTITTGSSTEVPSSVAVKNITDGKANAPSTNTANRIPQWNGANSKTLKDGLDFAMTMGSTPSDAKVLSEKAVSDAIAAAFTSALASGGSIPQAISSAISAALTATGAIGSALAGKVGAPSSTTQDYIPQWDLTSKTLKNGKEFVTSVYSSSSENQIPSASAVYALFSTVSGGARVSQYQPYDGESGRPTGCLVYCTNASYEGLYINLGSDSQAIWKKIFAPAT